MPLTKEHKQKSRGKILAGAVALFTQHGFAKVTIDDVMQYCGMTRGAFYAHFDSKEDLYSEAIRTAASQSEIVKRHFKGLRGQNFIDTIIDGYLSKQHLSGAISPCPLAFLATDVANNNEKIREVYTEVYNNLVSLMSCESDANGNDDVDDLMMAVTAMMIGGVAVSRALLDRKMTDRLLASCRAVAHKLVANNKK